MSAAGLIGAHDSPDRDAVRDIVMAKLHEQGNIILCLENIDDWCNTHTRQCVMEVRALRHICLVSTARTAAASVSRQHATPKLKHDS